MLIKINRKTCLEQFPLFPLSSYDYLKDEEEYYYPKVFASHILTFASKSFKGHISILGTSLGELSKGLHYDSLIFLGDADRA